MGNGIVKLCMFCDKRLSDEDVRSLVVCIDCWRNPELIKKENANSGYPLLGDSYERYELIRDYEDPCGTINKGVIKTEYQWMARFALLNPGDCKIKKDWFKAVESE